MHSPELAAVRELIASRHLDAGFSRVRDHAVLALPQTYEQLLASFGSTTRHNFRYYRRRCEAAGHVYRERLSMGELRSAAADLEPRCSKDFQPGSITRALTMVAAAREPLMAGVRHRNGGWLSIIGGMYRPGCGVLFLQLNDDREYPRDSLSVVLRAYVIETLIRQGMKEFIIWAGTSAPISRYASFIPTVGIHLDSTGLAWRIARGFVSMAGPWLPGRFRADARWIAPFR